MINLKPEKFKEKKPYKDYLNAYKNTCANLPKNDNLKCKCGHTKIQHLQSEQWTSCTIGTCNCIKYRWNTGYIIKI